MLAPISAVVTQQPQFQEISLCIYKIEIHWKLGVVYIEDNYAKMISYSNVDVQNRKIALNAYPEGLVRLCTIFGKTPYTGIQT